MRALLLVPILLLAACVDLQPQTFRPPLPDYSHRPVLDLAVRDIAVDSAYQPHGATPYIDHTLPVTPAAAARALLQHQLQAEGGDDSLRVSIAEASIREEPLQTQTGFSGLITAEDASRLDGELKVTVERLDEIGVPMTTISTTAKRSKGIPETATWQRRQELQHQLVLELVDDLERGLADSVRANFPDLLTP